jgi:hypothetical protein
MGMLGANIHGVDGNKKARNVERDEVEEPHEAGKRLEDREQHIDVAQVADDRGGVPLTNAMPRR